MKLVAIALAALLSILSVEAQPVIDTGIQGLVAELASAWNPDVALVDVDCSTTVGTAAPIQSELLLVLAREGSEWSIAAFHNTAVPAAPVVR